MIRYTLKYESKNSVNKVNGHGKKRALMGCSVPQLISRKGGVSSGLLGLHCLDHPVFLLTYAIPATSCNALKGLIKGYNMWQDRIADTKEATEEWLQKQGFNWDFDDLDTLIVWRTLPAFQTHPITGETVFFAQP